MNGQAIKFISIPNDRLCPVAAALCIRARAQRLNTGLTSPIGVYQIDLSSSTQFVKDIEINTFIQEAVKATYRIQKQDDLLKWHCHSFRVSVA